MSVLSVFNNQSRCLVQYWSLGIVSWGLAINMSHNHLAVARTSVDIGVPTTNELSNFPDPCSSELMQHCIDIWFICSEEVIFELSLAKPKIGRYKSKYNHVILIESNCVVKNFFVTPHYKKIRRDQKVITTGNNRESR